MVTKQVIEMVNPFVKVMQNRVPEYKGICSLLSIKRPYNSKYSKDIFPRYIRYFINSKCLKISMKEYENINSNRYMSETRSKKCDHAIKILLDSTHLTFPAIIIALGYISNLRKNTITTSLLHHQNNSEVKILTLALMASMKAHYDNVYSNKSWSTVSGIPLRELNILESNFLRDINFNLYIDEKIFFDFMDRVENSLNEYYEAISESAMKEKNNMEDIENTNTPSKISQNLKRTSAMLTPTQSPRDKNEYEPKRSQDNSLLYRKSSSEYLNVPDKNYMGKRISSSSIPTSEGSYKLDNGKIIESYKYPVGISTSSIYSSESEISDLKLSQNRDNHRIEPRNSIQSFKSRNEQCNSYRGGSDNEYKNRYSYINRSDNKNDSDYSRTMNTFNNIKFKIEDSENEQKSSIKSKPTKYFSSIPSFLHKYHQKFENGDFFKSDNNTNKNNFTERSNEVINDKPLHSSPIQISKRNTIHSSPVQMNKVPQNLRNNSIKEKPLSQDTNQQYIPNRTSSNFVQQFIPKRTSSNNNNLNVPNRFSYNGYNNKMGPVIETPENLAESNNEIKQSKSISIAYQTKRNQQMVDSSNQLFKHKTVSLPSYPVNSNGYPQGQYPVPYYQQQVTYPSQTPIQPIYPYYMDVMYPMKRSNTPQSSTQIGVIYDTNVVQPQIPHPPNPAMIQPQSINSATIPSAIPSPISPQSFTYSNGITIRQNSYNSNYSTPSPYTGNIMATSMNNLYYPTENTISTPVHIISPPPPLINPSLSQYSYSSQEYADNDYYGKSLDNGYSSYDENLYYHDIVENTNSYNGESSITRSNTIGGSQNIRSELNVRSNIPNQYLYPNSQPTINTMYGFDPIPRSNSCTNEYQNSNNYDGIINHSFSYDNTRKNYSNDIFRNDSLNRNSGCFDPNINYGYMSSSFPIVYNSNNLSIASSASSQVTDNGSYYNKRRSGFSNFFKKKSNNNRFSNDYQHLGDNNKKSFRSNSISNKNCNNNDKGLINRSRSYSSSFRFNIINHTNNNNNNFNNYTKDKSKLNNISTISNSEDTSFSINKSSSVIKYSDNEEDRQTIQKNEINENEEKIDVLHTENEDLNREQNSGDELENIQNINNNIHDDKDKDINIIDTHHFNESVINEYINESEDEPSKQYKAKEPENEQFKFGDNEFIQTEKTNYYDHEKYEFKQSQQTEHSEYSESYEQSKQTECTKYENSIQNNDKKVEENGEMTEYEKTEHEQTEQYEHYNQIEQLEQLEQYEKIDQYEPQSVQLEQYEEIDQDKQPEQLEQYEEIDQYEPQPVQLEQYEEIDQYKQQPEQLEQYEEIDQYKQQPEQLEQYEEIDQDNQTELSNKEGNVVYVKYNPEAYAKKMLDIENRRYSSISTYHLDNQSIISRNNKYNRYSECNFDSFIYDNFSFHIENIKNELTDNGKIANTIISVNSNEADADFNSERESYRPIEHSYISSIVGTNDDQSDSNINYYINHEEVDNTSYLGSIRSSIDEFYDREKDRKSERISIRSRSDFVNTSFSSINSNPISIDSHSHSHIIIDKSLPPPHRIIKKAIRTNSTPIYGTKTSPYMASKTSPYMSTRTSPYMSSRTSPYMSSRTSPLIGEEVRVIRRYSNLSNLSNISASKSEDNKYKIIPESKPKEKIATITGGRKEPKIIKVHSKKSGIKKTMSLILESGSKIFTKKQSQSHQSKAQNKNDNIKKISNANKGLPPIPSEGEYANEAKTELKLDGKKHSSFTSMSTNTEIGLKLSKESYYTDISKLKHISHSMSNIESASSSSIINRSSPIANTINVCKSPSSRISVVSTNRRSIS